ncbi:MAG: carboxypeptidase regulatory-like domain-containing protein [Planctomycetota bacterium]
MPSPPRTKWLFVVLVAICLIALLAAYVGSAGWFGSGAGPIVPEAPVPAPTPAVGEVATVSETPSAPAAPRVEAAAPTAPVPSATAAIELRGRVLDSRGQPLAGVPLQLREFDFGVNAAGATVPGARARSDAVGVFAMTAPPLPSTVVLADAGYVTLRTTPVRAAAAATEVLVVVAVAQDIAGFVHDAAGAPIAGAEVRCAAFLLSEFPWPIERTVAPTPAAERAVTTGEDGRFTLAATPVAAGVSLVFMRSGYRARRLATTEVQRGFVDVTLEKEVAGDRRILGTVLDAAGRALAGAGVGYGSRQKCTSGPDGGFAFDLEATAQPVVATFGGCRPATTRPVDKDTPMPLVVQFAARTLEIRGRVVDDDGAPVRGALVNLVDPERAPGGGSLEKRSASGAEADVPAGARARTDADGAFVITGLLERAYRVRAWDLATAASVVSEPVMAGARELVLVLGAGAFVAELRGRVTTRDGVGVPGIVVNSHLLADNVDDITLVFGPHAATGEDGRFALRRVPARHVVLSASGEDFEYVTAKVEDCLAQGEATLVVVRKCYVQVEGGAGLWVQFLDAAGAALSVTVSSVGMSVGGNGIDLREGRSPVATVAETAATMVWWRNGKEVGRRPVALLPGRAQKNLLVVPD